MNNREETTITGGMDKNFTFTRIESFQDTQNTIKNTNAVNNIIFWYILIVTFFIPSNNIIFYNSLGTCS